VVSEQRPVPLWQHMLVGKRLFDLFADTATLEVNPDLVRMIREEERRASWSPTRPPRGGRRPRHIRTPSRADVVERLDRDALLPSIVFVFSRVGCEAAVAQCMRAGLRLTEPEDRAAIREIAERHTAEIPDEDLQVLGYWEWREALEHGVAAHHAGLIPAFKETVEELFLRGLVKAVFATETLALGINMPARSVVLERLMKFNGETHAELTPGEYTQLTGRAGRRGIDVEGHAVVLWTLGMQPAQVAGLASKRTYPLRSSFRPSYNMAVNLVGQMGRAQARTLLESSFAQFQADRAVVGLARQIQRNEEALAGYGEAMTCELGDIDEYTGLRARLSERESMLARESAAVRRAEAAASLERLKIGDVIRVPAGRRAGVAVVVDPGFGSGFDTPVPTVLTIDRRVHRLSVVDVPTPVEPVGRVRIPKTFNLRSPRSRRDLASSLRNLDLPERPHRSRKGRESADDEITRLRAALREHPCHGCPDREEHAHSADGHRSLQRATEGLQRRVESRTNSLARTFDRVCAVLESRDYLSGEKVTDDGRRLARIWAECDLLVAECLRRGTWEGLDPAELAAVVSALVFESRQGEPGVGRVPNAVREPVAATMRLWADLAEDEQELHLERTREPDTGFAWPVYRWAHGESLERALSASDGTGDDLPAGDFVRWCKQLIDLLDQIAGIADEPLARTARAAVAAVRRGVVASTGIR
jgi:ATP-dependent RNA helicase HelY